MQLNRLMTPPAGPLFFEGVVLKRSPLAVSAFGLTFETVRCNSQLLDGTQQQVQIRSQQTQLSGRMTITQSDLQIGDRVLAVTMDQQTIPMHRWQLILIGSCERRY